MEKNNLVKNIIKVCSRLENLCEGFDIDSKTNLISSKLKVLLFIGDGKNVSPSDIIDKVGLAKSNLALLCKSLYNEGLISKNKDAFDSRVIFYSLTEKGQNYLDEQLDNMTKNFKGQLAYKNMFREIDRLLVSLKDIIE